MATFVLRLFHYIHSWYVYLFVNLSSRHDERVKITRSELSKDMDDEAATAYASFPRDPAIFPHNYHLAPLPVISHLHPGLTTMLQPISRQAPAIAVGESLVPINLFDALQAASQSQAKSDAIVQKMAESVQKIAESVQKIAESLSMECVLRAGLQNQVEQQGESIQTLAESLVMERGLRIELQNLLMTTSETLAMERDERIWLKNQVEELKNVVHEMKSKIEVLS